MNIFVYEFKETYSKYQSTSVYVESLHNDTRDIDHLDAVNISHFYAYHKLL